MLSKITRFAFWLILILSLPRVASSQTATLVRGRVVSTSGGGVDAVTVLVLGLPDSTVMKTALTDRDGTFELDIPAAGTYLISLSVLGEKTFFGPLAIGGPLGKPVVLKDIILKPAVKGLKEVVVWERSRFIERKAGKTVLNVSSGNIVIGNNALEILNRAPGIQLDKNDNFLMKGKNGVVVMINGKTSNLTGSDVADLLRNTPYEAIDRIDLITTPPAHYDAAGGAGIIDIHLKKGKNVGTNGSLNFGAGYGDFHKVNSGLTLNHRTVRVNVFGSYNYSNNKRPETIKLNRQINNSTLTSLQVNNLDNKTRTAQNYNAGIDYSINSRHTLGLLFTGMNQTMHSDEQNSTRVSNNSMLDSNIMMFSDENRRINNAAYNVNYRGLLDKKGQEITLDLDYFTYARKSLERLENRFLTRMNTSYRSALNYQNSSPSNILITSAKAGYIKPLSKRSSVNIGVKTSFVESKNNRVFENYSANVWVKDANKSDQFDFSEHINAAYINYKNSFGGNTELEAGLRTEETTNRSRAAGSNHTINRKYLNFFPTFQLSHLVNKANKLNFAFSKRINRPLYEDLNPFLYFLDQYNFRKGNPYLKPEYTSTYEVQHIYKEKFTSTLNYSHVKDIFLDFQEQDDLSQVTVQSKRNLNSQKSVGLELSTDIDYTKWWNGSYTVQGSYMHFTYFSDGNTLDTQSPYYIVDASNTFSFPKDLVAELLFNYESATNYGLFDFRPTYSVNLAVSKSVLKNKASVRFSLSDLFNTSSTRYSSLYKNLNIQALEKAETRVGKISFNYRFGKTSVKGARKRSTAAEEESKRIRS